jgi:hypothetical protein
MTSFDEWFQRATGNDQRGFATVYPVKGFLVCVNQKELRFRIAEPGVREGAAA